jgi:hypothetical protein
MAFFFGLTLLLHAKTRASIALILPNSFYSIQLRLVKEGKYRGNGTEALLLDKRIGQ